MWGASEGARANAIDWLCRDREHIAAFYKQTLFQGIPIVTRIFEEFASGRSPRAIAALLNKNSVPGPRQKHWGMSTVYGNWRRGTGVFNNELYIGRLVWNLQRFIKDPETGKRQARLNPSENWIVQDVPELRIVEQSLWDSVKARQRKTRSTVTDPETGNPVRARRPKYLFSGLLKCGRCDGGYTLVSKHHYGCANSRNKSTCENYLTIKREALEDIVLEGLKDMLLSPGLISEFPEEYNREFNRLIAASQNGKKLKHQELSKVTRHIEQIACAIADCMYHPSLKANWLVWWRSRCCFILN